MVALTLHARGSAELSVLEQSQHGRAPCAVFAAGEVRRQEPGRLALAARGQLRSPSKAWHEPWCRSAAGVYGSDRL